MRICDLCNSVDARPYVEFEAELDGVKFSVNVNAVKQPGAACLDICYDCGAKGALFVLGAFQKLQACKPDA